MKVSLKKVNETKTPEKEKEFYLPHRSMIRECKSN